MNEYDRRFLADSTFFNIIARYLLLFLPTCQKRHQSNFSLFGGEGGGIICVSKLTWLWHDRRWGENCLSPLWRRFALPRTFECWYPLLNCIKKTGKGGEKKKKIVVLRERERERETLTRCNFWITQHSPCRIWGASQECIDYEVHDENVKWEYYHDYLLINSRASEDEICRMSDREREREIWLRSWGLFFFFFSRERIKKNKFHLAARVSPNFCRDKRQFNGSLIRLVQEWYTVLHLVDYSIFRISSRLHLDRLRINEYHYNWNKYFFKKMWREIVRGVVHTDLILSN